MPQKKGKGKKGKKAVNSAAKAEVLRLAQLRALEAETEDIQDRENERREKTEQEERISLVRDEQLRQIRDKEKRIEELNDKVSMVMSTLKDDRLSYESQIEQLSVVRDSLLNEVSLLRSENDEKQNIFFRERQNNVVEIGRLRTDVEEIRVKFECEKSALREQIHTANSIIENERQKCELAVDEKDKQEREYETRNRALERELQKALTMNVALQDAVEKREVDDKKNVILMQLLNVQLDECKHHFEEQLEDERQATLRAKEEILRLETNCSHLREELDLVKSESAETKRKCDAELREYQQSLEQVKFDVEYLSNEIESMRIQLSDAVEEANLVKAKSERDYKNYVVEIEGLQKKIEDMEALLHKKERDYYDKATFLNAQLSNNRTVISKLQQKLSDERVGHEAELSRRAIEVQTTLNEIKKNNEEEMLRSQMRAQQEKVLLTDVATLKDTVLQLRKVIDENEQKSESMQVAKDEEIKRLRDLLDAHFIPNRKDMEVVSNSVKVDTIAVLREKLEDKTREMRLRDQAAAETEIWLKSRLANQADTIASLQADLKSSEVLRAEDIRCLEDEIARLKKILEVHYVPCIM